jgi:hypothetical protein
VLVPRLDVHTTVVRELSAAPPGEQGRRPSAKAAPPEDSRPGPGARSAPAPIASSVLGHSFADSVRDVTLMLSLGRRVGAGCPTRQEEQARFALL